MFLSLAVALLAIVIMNGYAFADSDVTPVIPAESEPAAAEGEPEAPVVEGPVEEALVPLESEVEPSQQEIVEPVDETELAANPVDEPCEEAAAPVVEVPVDELGTILLPPAEAAKVEKIGESVASAAQLSGAGDPRWLVGTQWYSVIYEGGTCYGNSGGIGCFSYASDANLIQEAFNRMQNLSKYPTNGLLYVDAGTYQGFTINDIDLNIIKGVIGESSNNTFIHGDILVQNKTNGFTLSGFSISGGVEVKDSSGNITFSDLVVSNPDGTGIKVTGTWKYEDEFGNPYDDEGPHYSGTVTLNNVNSSSNHGAGAYILASNTIKVTNSIFNNNNIDIDTPTAGLYLDNWWWTGAFSQQLNNVIASQNRGNGINIFAGSAVMQNVIANDNTSDTASGSGIFTEIKTSFSLTNATLLRNRGDGLSFLGYKGANTIVILKNVIANNNGVTGVYIENKNAGAITLTGLLTDNNPYYGVQIISGGVVKLTTIRASGNFHGLLVQGYEKWVYDPTAKEYVFNSLISPVSVTLTSPVDPNFTNVFNNNFGGIVIMSEKPVFLTNFIANGNSLSGVWVQGMCKEGGVPGTDSCTKAGAVTVRSTLFNFINTIRPHDGMGINIYDSKGTVIIERTAIDGAPGDGIYISTLGAITLKDVKSNNGTSNGAYLDNQAALTVQPITVTNCEFTGNTGNGVYARSKGMITITDIKANDNDLSGADLDNCLLDDGSGLCLGSGTITITNASGKLNTFNNNGRFGVWAVSKGAITVTNIQANNNGSDGASLRNNYGGSIANVTVAVSGVTRNEFNGNGLDESYMPVDDYYKVGLNGLTIKTLGNIIVKNVLAQNNQNEGGGIVVRNDESVTPKTVMISDCYVSGNDWHGLFVWSKGNITLTNISADTNHLSGVFTDNCLYNDGSGTCGGTGTVSLSNITSNNNWSRGIEVYSKGVINLTDVSTNGNTGDEGIFLENDYSGSTASVTLKNITSKENNNNGVLILTNGAVTLSNITANNNHRMQGWLNDGQTAQDWYNAEKGDDRWSFYLEAGTAYTINMLGSGVNVSPNISAFVPMMNLYAESAPETLINSGQSINFTPGTSGWYYVLVKNNDSTDGMYRISLAGNETPIPDSPDLMYWVDGVAVVAKGNVTVTNGTFDDNSLSGLFVRTNGNIIASNVGGSLNGTDGLDLYNDGGIGNITLTGSNLANSNGWYGIDVRTNGVLSLTNLEASNNGQFGVKIDAQGAGKAVTLKGITVMENLLDGLNISANGKLVLNDIRSWLNGGSGAMLDTHGNALLVQASVFMCNGDYGLEYKDYVLPFTFTDKTNIYFGNTSGGIHKN